MKTDPNCTASLEPSTHTADFAPTDKDFERMMQMLTGFFVTQTASAVATYSIAEHLAKGPATAQQIASIEGIDSTATFRLLRACAAANKLWRRRDVRPPSLMTDCNQTGARLVVGLFSVTAAPHWLSKDGIENISCKCCTCATLLQKVMPSKVYSAAVVGVDAFEVEIEVHAGCGGGVAGYRSEGKQGPRDIGDYEQCTEVA